MVTLAPHLVYMPRPDDHRLDFHDFCFFSLADFVDFFDEFVGELLHLVLAPEELVLRDHFLLLKLSEILQRIAAQIAHGDAALFDAS